MSYLLFPGRHLLTTAFQAAYLQRVIHMPMEQLAFLEGNLPQLEPIDQIIFAVTSANQEHSRYNPIPFHVRAIGVDRFARHLESAFDLTYRIFGIPHYKRTPRFARYVLQEIEEQSEGNLRLTPENCVVLCCTPAVNQLYQALGFAILPAEAGEDPKPGIPNDYIRRTAEIGPGWQTDPVLRRGMSAAAFDLWQDFPDVPRRIIRLWRDPLLNDAGSLTDERDYASYAYGMGNREIINVKYRDIKGLIRPGKIVDEGCADGALLAAIATDFPDSDLIGIEITGEFMARARERQRAGGFGGSYIHFHQRNITQRVFEDQQVDTTICNSTVHELFSYGDGSKTVQAYLALKFAQTRKGGRLVIRDVVGPTDKDAELYAWLEQGDGVEADIFAEFAQPADLATHLATLSTYDRFKRFARDFRAARRREGLVGPQTQLRYREETVAGVRYIVTSRKVIAEYLSKKDYLNNWDSEMFETFTFWEFQEWKAALQAAGFRVIEDPNAPQNGSRVYTNPWIIANRWAGKVKLFRRDQIGTLQPEPYPETNIVLVGERQ